MEPYRLYYFEDGHIVRFQAFEAQSDAQALQLADDAATGDAMELWSGGRFLKSWSLTQPDCVVG